MTTKLLPRISALALATLALLSVSEAGAQAAATVRVADVIGCYQLSPINWAPGAPDPIPGNMILPEVIMLRGDSLRINLAADQPSLWFTMSPVADKIANRPGSSRWTPLGSDSIEVAWVPTRSPLKLLLAVRGNTLQGTATALSDAGPARGTGTISGTRTTCPKGWN